ncbi:MAG: hypothetical protein APG12_00476 [Candidatus Methanofastidiosum methylothiophilum]|uniref:Uncharacterized protein n=1 Tax=Candidatus Methanofastidiosum methylothiophilum TaxID=1705564 RepID=A0A150ITE8_9EURY|nr:MAG: hypothetical protein APG10_00369 [Candidatus Methanofastidiosum methylthiophilus]KYC48256.1 MAG: hypothetical protein APG11_00495 [Candidatus Methanofastidiosum methylthiophilus]KYC50913.1 MAG: hypothetical protein APG12_00476 [Candidatus Methanofastidiosum methylthiophilus]
MRYYEPKIGLNYEVIKRIDYMDDSVKNRNLMIKKLIVSKKEVDLFE